MGVYQERRKFSRWLRSHGIRFVVTHRSCELEGAPSHLIVDRPPRFAHALGVAVLFKNPERLPKTSQSDWLMQAARSGWKTLVVFSVEEAMRETALCGYPVQNGGDPTKGDGP